MDMTTKAHTPGPWKLFVGHADWGMPMSHTIFPEGAADDYGNVIAEIPSVQPYCMGAKQKDIKRARVQAANANLIAAAPDLLAALEELAEAGAEAWGEQRPCVRIAMEAIKRATGAESGTDSQITKEKNQQSAVAALHHDT
jgi:hypothetical protein